LLKNECQLGPSMHSKLQGNIRFYRSFLAHPSRVELYVVISCQPAWLQAPCQKRVGRGFMIHSELIVTLAASQNKKKIIKVNISSILSSVLRCRYLYKTGSRKAHVKIVFAPNLRLRFPGLSQVKPQAPLLVVLFRQILEVLA